MKVMILGDLHWGARSDNTTFLEHFADYFDNVFFPLVEQVKPDVIIQVGDVFDKRSYLNVNTLYYVRTRFIEPLSESGIPTYILPGNHDIYFKNTNRVNSLNEVYGHYGAAAKGIHLVLEPTTYNGMLILPWISPDDANQSFEALRSSEAAYCFGHFDFAGFDLGGGRQSDEGFDKNLFRKFKLVVSGHYHARQAAGNIFYCGVPYEKTWEDFGQWIGVHVLDTETGKITAYPNNNHMHHILDWKDGSLSSSPDPGDTSDGFYYLAKKIIRLVVHDNNHPVKLEKLIGKISAAKPESLSVVHRALSIDGAKVINELKDANPDDTVTTIKTYIGNMEGVPEKDAVLNILLGLHNKAVQNQAGGE